MELCNRIRLKNLYDAGIQSPCELHTRTRIPLSTINDNLAKFRRDLGPERKCGSGASPKLKAVDKRRIAAIANKNRKLSAKRIAIKAQEGGTPKVHERTIQRYLKSIGWKKQVPLKRPYLTAAMKRKRLKWCLDHRNFNWSNVVFSDESKFQLYRITQKQWGKKRISIPVPKHSPSTMVWGAISARGKSILAIVNGSIDANKYRDILDEYLLETMNQLYPDGWVYQQDNATPHTAKLTKKWFTNHSVRVLDFPPGSPDLNPIELLWAIMKQKGESKIVNNLGELKKVVGDTWEELDMDLVKSLIESMSERIEKCIAVKGQTINL